MRSMRSIYLSQAFASEAVFMHLLFAPLCQNLSKPRNLSYFPLKIRSRPKKGENRPRLWTERLDSWVSKSPGSEKTPPRRQLQISARNGINLLELRPSKNTVTPVSKMVVFSLVQHQITNCQPTYLTICTIFLEWVEAFDP